LANLIPTGNRDLGNLIAALAPTSTNSATSPNPSAPAQYLVYGHWVRGAIQGLCQQAERSLTPERLLQAPSPALLTQLMRGLSSSASAAMQLIVEQLQSLLANCGLSDDERALNFLLLTRPEPYTLSFSQLWNSASDGPNPAGYQLIGVRTEAARCATRPQVKVIFDFSGINTGAPLSWYFVVDTAGEFPFLPAPPEARRYLKSTFA
jgi:hypothetical protein